MTRKARAFLDSIEERLESGRTSPFRSGVSAPMTTAGKPADLSSASLAVFAENQELQKRLAVLEDAEKRSSSGPSDLELHMDRRMPEIQDLYQVEELKKLFQKAQELDLVFLVDATGSMQELIVTVKNLVPKIVEGIKKAFPKIKLYAAFVPYRDYGEHDQDKAETCDFTDSFVGPASTFVKAVARVKAGGGDDAAEDVFSGLERVATLGWRSKTRLLIHIGDAPCHGREYHDGVGDKYPNGDRKGRNIGKLLEALRYDCQILNYLFCHINPSTKKMLTVFRERAPQGEWIQEQKLENINNLLELVVSASCSSISQSTRVIREGPFVLRYVPVAWKNEEPKWDSITPQTAFQYIIKPPATLKALFKIVDDKRSLEMETTPSAMVQIARKPFSDAGTMRWPFFAQKQDPKSPSTPPERMVVKRFKDVVGEDVREVHTLESYSEQMELQTVAAFLAKYFNQKIQRFSGPPEYKTVQFTTVSVLSVGGTKLYNMEKRLEGTWIRFSNNVNYVNTEEYTATLHAFSHWTYERSEGRLMVTDLQGVQVDGPNGNKVFMLCDPAVHCSDLNRYKRTKTNWGSMGMDSFFVTHRCNNICRSLKLTRRSPDLEPTFEGTVIR